jgi:hypothetical protein
VSPYSSSFSSRIVKELPGASKVYYFKACPGKTAIFITQGKRIFSRLIK